MTTTLMLPPSLFPPDMQPLIYFTIMPCIILFGAIFLFILWFFVVPPEAKVYIRNKISRKDMFDIETESGVRILDTGIIYPEGIAILDRTKLKLLIGKPIPANQIAMSSEETTPEKLDEIIQKIRDTEKVTLKPSIVQGLGCRLHRVYQSSAIATSLANLVGLQYSGESKSSPMAIPILAKNGKRIEPAKLFIKKGKELKEWIVDVALPVDPSIVRAWESFHISPSSTDKLFYLGERYTEVSRSGGFWKKWLVPILIILIIAVIAVVAVVLLSGGGSPPVQPPPT